MEVISKIDNCASSYQTLSHTRKLCEVKN